MHSDSEYFILIMNINSSKYTTLRLYMLEAKLTEILKILSICTQHCDYGMGEDRVIKHYNIYKINFSLPQFVLRL